MQRGKFIVLEGGEGAGKGSVRRFLEGALPDAVFTREPGGTPLGEKVRNLMLSPEAATADAETQMSLVFASRLHHVREKITPALEAGKIVISERFDSSTYAYQIHGQQALHLKPLFFEFRKLLGSTVPDLYIFLDVKTETGLMRLKKGTLDHFETRNVDFHTRVREGYAEFFKTVSHVIIDANRSLEAVEEDVLSYIKKILKE